MRGSEQPCRAETYPSSDESGTGDDNVDDTSEGFATEESFAVADGRLAGKLASHPNR